MQKPELIFDPVEHRYFRIEGDVRVEVPGVTSVLSSLGFSDWGRIDPGDLAAAQERGTDVHRATELIDRDQLDYSSVSDEVSPYLAAYLKFKAELRPHLIENELMVYNKVYGYAGTLDRVAVFDSGSPMLYDIKTGPRMPLHKMQTAAYLDAYNFMRPVAHVRRRASLYLLPTGNYALDQQTGPDDIRAFYAALQLYHWRKNNV